MRGGAFALDGATPDIGYGTRCNLALPGLLSGEDSEHVEARFLSASRAEVGELLCVHINEAHALPLLDILVAFLRAAVGPSVIGCGKLFVVPEKRAEGIVFITRDAWLPRWQRRSCVRGLPLSLGRQ